MLKAFLTGKDEGAAGAEEPSVDLARFSSLSAFDADFEVSAGIRLLNLEADQLTVAAPGAPLPPPAERAALPGISSPPAALPATNAAPPPAPPSVLPAAAETSEAAAAQEDQLLGQMAKKVKESGLRPRRFMKLLKKFLRGLMQEMRANHAVDGEKAKRGEKILEKFFEQMEPPAGVSEVAGSRVSVQQQRMSLHYEMHAEMKTPPRLEEIV
jgi:hypothetical protein